MTSPTDHLFSQRQEGEVCIEYRFPDFTVRWLPPDPLALRISIGEGTIGASLGAGYCVIRGADLNHIQELLERTLERFKTSRSTLERMARR